ncbi:MAG: hypothetical protein K2H84_00770 [Paramuribaculum sp.]|nr:hypothetical protein [Paramuribaculum sp.]
MNLNDPEGMIVGRAKQDAPLVADVEAAMRKLSYIQIALTRGCFQNEASFFAVRP